MVAEITQRLNFLQRVGLGYLSLDRSATTLSGGETQRIRLASQLGCLLYTSKNRQKIRDFLNSSQ